MSMITLIDYIVNNNIKKYYKIPLIKRGNVKSKEVNLYV